MTASIKSIKLPITRPNLVILVSLQKYAVKPKNPRNPNFPSGPKTYAANKMGQKAESSREDCGNHDNGWIFSAFSDRDGRS